MPRLVVASICTSLIAIMTLAPRRSTSVDGRLFRRRQVPSYESARGHTYIRMLRWPSWRRTAHARLRIGEILFYQRKRNVRLYAPLNAAQRKIKIAGEPANAGKITISYGIGFWLGFAFISLR